MNKCYKKEIEFAAILHFTALSSGSPTPVPTEGKLFLPWNAAHTRRLQQQLLPRAELLSHAYAFFSLPRSGHACKI